MACSGCKGTVTKKVSIDRDRAVDEESAEDWKGENAVEKVKKIKVNHCLDAGPRFPPAPSCFPLVGLVCVLGHDIVLYYSKLESAYLGRAS